MNKISDAAVEAAGKAISMYLRGSEVTWREDKNTARVALEAALPHLQPTPAGQGDVRALAEQITDRLCHHEYDIGGRAELLACVVEALAARQPVGLGDERHPAEVWVNVYESGQFREASDTRERVGADGVGSVLRYVPDGAASRQPVGQEPVPKMVSTAPERIFLQIGDGDYSDEPFPHPVGEEITWCSDSIVESEVAYVRADLATPQVQAVDLGQYRDLIGFAALAAINLPETDPRRDFIRQAGEFAKLIDSSKAVQS